MDDRPGAALAPRRAGDAELPRRRPRRGGRRVAHHDESGGAAARHRVVEAGVGVPARAAERERAAAGCAARREYLAQVAEADYAQLFGESLTEATLASIIDAVHDVVCAGDAQLADADGRFATSVLRGLASTRRFDMLVMFLDAKVQSRLGQVFGALRKHGALDGDALARAFGQR